MKKSINDLTSKVIAGINNHISSINGPAGIFDMRAGLINVFSNKEFSEVKNDTLVGDGWKSNFFTIKDKDSDKVIRVEFNRNKSVGSAFSYRLEDGKRHDLNEMKDGYNDGVHISYLKESIKGLIKELRKK